MRYITNANSQIIGADESFLEKLGVDDIAQIYHKIAQNDIVFDYLDNQLELKVLGSSEKYEVIKTSLNSLLGTIYIIKLRAINDLSSDESSIIDDNILKVAPLAVSENIDLPEDDIKEKDSKESIDDILLVDDSIDTKEDLDDNSIIEEDSDDMFNLLLDSDKTPLVSLEQEDEVRSVEEESDDEIMDLFSTDSISLEDSSDTANTEVDVEKVEDKADEFGELDNTPILLDADELSKVIGLSPEDYKSFVDEYIQTAETLRDEIGSGDNSKKATAIQTLRDLSLVLHIPSVIDILSDLEHSDSLTTNILIGSLYNIIDRLEVKISAKQKDEKIENIALVEDLNVESIEVENDSQESIDISTESLEVEDSTSVTAHKIDLSDIKPIHFDFSMEEAANDLSLPVDLIDEFVHDFIDQAHEETEKMLTAYDEGDLDRVNKIGHLLKGTSSNLRITPLADTLYKIQFCENLDELEPLIKDYWGHFIAFETHIKMRRN